MISWDAEPPAPFYRVIATIKRIKTPDEVLQVTGPAPSFTLSSDQSRYSLCMSNRKTGASCENIEGYKGPSFNTPYDPGQEIKYRVGACADSTPSSCSFADSIDYVVPGQLTL